MRERVPLQWAMTQTNLGNALALLGMRLGESKWLKEAVAAYGAALEERTRDRVPLDWALTQSNLGNALQGLGEMEGSVDLLEQADAAYSAALVVLETAGPTQHRERVQRNLEAVRRSAIRMDST